MPGDMWQQFANTRLLYGYQWTLPGKKLLFMGTDFGQWDEWNFEKSLDWHLLEHQTHQGLKRWVRDLNTFYRGEPALHKTDCDHNGFDWLGADDGQNSVLSYRRRDPETDARSLWLVTSPQSHATTTALVFLKADSGVRPSIPTPKSTTALTLVTMVAANRKTSLGTVNLAASTRHCLRWQLSSLLPLASKHKVFNTLQRPWNTYVFQGLFLERELLLINQKGLLYPYLHHFP